MNFHDKVVLITGASSGIGAGTAEYFAKFGASLSLVGRNVDNLTKVAEKCSEINQNNPNLKPLIIVADISVEQDVERIVQTTIEHFGKLNILVNNAGILVKGSIETATLKDYDTVMNTNVRAMFHLTQLAMSHLVATKGNIVNVSSVNGIRSFAGILIYNISKSAVDQFTRCVALEMANKGVRVNSVNPGVILTEIHKRGGLNDTEYANFLEHSKTTHALGRPGTVEEVAATIAFLASDSATFITGVQLPIDGGRHILCPR